MKSHRKSIVAVLVLTLIMTLFSTVSVSAASKPNSVRNFRYNAGRKGVTLRWTAPVGSYDHYYLEVYKNVNADPVFKGNIPKGTTSKWFSISYAAYFRLYAVKGGVKSNKCTIAAAPIRDITYIISVSGRGDRTAKKFSGGNYICENGDTISYTRVYDARADYTRMTNYSREDAQNFVNGQKFASYTPNFIWISTYTQHAYLFTGSKGKWKCVDDWECATGKATSPTPTGWSGRKMVWKKLRWRHSIPYWSCFSSMNAIHGRQEGWPVGEPASGGCVRNPNEKAEKVYKATWMDTSVLVY